MTITQLRWTRWATFMLFFANGFGFGAWASAIPPLKIALGLSAASLSFALLAMAAGAVFMMQVCGSLTQRLGGTGRATRWASFVFAPVLMLPAMSPNLAVLIVAAALLGATSGLMDVAMNAHASVVEEQWRAPIMSSFHAGFSIGGLAGTGFGALLLAVGVPTHWLMVPTAFIVMILVLCASPHLGVGENRRAGGTALQLPERRLLGLAAIVLFCFLIEGAMGDWSGLYLISAGVSTARAAAGYAAFSLTMILGRLLGDRIVQAFRTIAGGCAWRARRGDGADAGGGHPAYGGYCHRLCAGRCGFVECRPQCVQRECAAGQVRGIRDRGCSNRRLRRIADRSAADRRRCGPFEPAGGNRGIGGGGVLCRHHRIAEPRARRSRRCRFASCSGLTFLIRYRLATCNGPSSGRGLTGVTPRRISKWSCGLETSPVLPA